MKMVFFANAEHVGLQFELCAAVQTAFDAYLGVQFWWFGNGKDEGEKLARRASGANELSEL